MCTAGFSGLYHLVFSARPRSDGKWMQIVFDDYYLQSDANYRLRFGQVVEKRSTNMTDEEARKCYNTVFSTHDDNLFDKYAQRYIKEDGGFAKAFHLCLNGDQRKTRETWREGGRKK